MNDKFICVHCYTKQTTKYVKAMMQAGFELWHLNCKECGQKAIVSAIEAQIALNRDIFNSKQIGL